MFISLLLTTCYRANGWWGLTMNFKEYLQYARLKGGLPRFAVELTVRLQLRCTWEHSSHSIRVAQRRRRTTRCPGRYTTHLMFAGTNWQEWGVWVPSHYARPRRRPRQRHTRHARDVAIAPAWEPEHSLGIQMYSEEVSNMIFTTWCQFTNSYCNRKV